MLHALLPLLSPMALILTCRIILEKLYSRYMIRSAVEQGVWVSPYIQKKIKIKSQYSFKLKAARVLVVVLL